MYIIRTEPSAVFIYALTILSHQIKLTAAQLKKGTAQGFKLANSARISINLSWYDYTTCF